MAPDTAPPARAGRCAVNTPTPATHTSTKEDLEPHRLCVFELDLTCGHRVTVSLNGWYPVSVACCDRLGGSWVDGAYHPFDSGVEYVRCLSERYEHRPPGVPREPTVLLARRPRTDGPFTPVHRWQSASGGRFPIRVGGPLNTPHPEGAPPAAIDTPSGAATNRAKQPRLVAGVLAPLLLDHMSTYPDRDFSPYDLAKALGRSHGAIRTRLLALAGTGEVVRTHIRPARFQIARPAR